MAFFTQIFTQAKKVAYSGNVSELKTKGKQFQDFNTSCCILLHHA